MCVGIRIGSHAESRCLHFSPFYQRLFKLFRNIGRLGDPQGRPCRQFRAFVSVLDGSSKITNECRFLGVTNNNTGELPLVGNRILCSNSPIERAIIGFSGFGSRRRFSTMLRIGLCVFWAVLDDATSHCLLTVDGDMATHKKSSCVSAAHRSVMTEPQLISKDSSVAFDYVEIPDSDP